MNGPNYDKLLIFDCETTSIKPNYIVTIAWECYENGKRTGQGYNFCNPMYPISPQASAVNGLYDDDVKDYPTFDLVWEEIKPWFKDALLVGQNLKFDLSALALEFNRYDIEPFDYFYVDTLENARKLISKYDIPNYKLGTLCDYFGIKIDKFHDASFDVMATRKVFNKLINLSDGDLIIRTRYNQIYKEEE